MLTFVLDIYLTVKGPCTDDPSVVNIGDDVDPKKIEDESVLL